MVIKFKYGVILSKSNMYKEEPILDNVASELNCSDRRPTKYV